MDIMKALEAVVEADDASGAALIDAVVYDVMADLAESAREEITDLYGLWTLNQVSVAKRALGRRYVETVVEGEYPGEDVHKAAEWLVGLERFIFDATRPETVAKAGEWWDIDGRSIQRDVNRDTGGRFARGINQGAKVPLTDRVGQQAVISPTLRGGYFDDDNKVKGGLTPEQQEAGAKHQGQWEEANTAVAQLYRGFKGTKDNVEVAMQVQRGDGGLRMVRFPLKDFKDEGKNGAFAIPDLGQLRPNTNDSILSVELVPGRQASQETRVRVAAFNTLGETGGMALASLAGTKTSDMQALGNALKMPSPDQPKGFLDRVFGVFRAGGDVLSGVTGQEKLGAMAAFVGSAGPQAADVLDPYVRQAAYRYRGTEVTPKQGILNSLDSAAAREWWGSHAQRPDVDMSEESIDMQVRADQASAYLATTLPQDPIVARLSEESGQILPSRGILFDSDRKPVSEAIGFTDDHYLPFDLKNLGKLRGGSYARTRVNGGLTAEDIYTATTMGSRQAQVVSGSGVFTLEMAPDFRGARAMSDKARSMNDRYIKILDAVQNSGLYLEDLPQSAVNEIERQAQQEAKYSEDDIGTIRERLKEEKRAEINTLSTEQEDQIAVEALRSVGVQAPDGLTRQQIEQAAMTLRGDKRRRFDEEVADLQDRALSSKTNKLRLNGEGYNVALKTLQAQFPQYIRRVTYRPLNMLQVERGEGRELPRTRRYADDRGYVAPGGLRADRVRSGTFRTGNQTPPPRGSAPVSDAPAAPAVGTDTDPAPQGAADTSTPTTEGAGQPASSTNSLNKVLAAKAAPLNDRVQRKAVEISSGIASMRQDLVTNSTLAMALMGAPFGAAPDNQQRVLWMMAQPEDIPRTLSDPATRGKAIEALSDGAAVESAFREGLKSAGGTLLFEGGAKVGEGTDEASALKWFTESADAIATAGALMAPFAQALPDPKDRAFYTGATPQDLPDVAGVADGAAFERYAQQQPDVFAEATALAYDGDSARSIAQIGAMVRPRIEALQKVQLAKPNMSPNATEVAPLVLEQAVWSAAYPGKTLSVNGLAQSQPADDALKLQRAWSLAIAGRTFEEIGGEGGFPKVEGRLLKPSVVKAAPRLRVLAMDDPVSKAVQARVSKGLPVRLTRV